MNQLSNSIKAILATAAIAASSGAYAAGGVGVNSTWAVGGSDVLGAGGSLYSTASGTAIGSNNGWSDNSGLLGNDAWGHVGTSWLVFNNTATQNVNINASVLTGNYNVAFTVYATNGAFNGGTNFASSGLLETDTVGTAHSHPAHDFNQVGQLGANGTVWMTDPSVNANGQGNALETLGYANSGVAHTNTALNGYGQVINQGANNVAVDLNYFTALSGFVTPSGTGVQSHADLLFTNLQAGWYLVLLGSADSSKTSASTYELTVSSVPLPGAVYMFGAGLAGLAATARRKMQAA